jgi:hypothetical protein
MAWSGRAGFGLPSFGENMTSAPVASEQSEQDFRNLYQFNPTAGHLPLFPLIKTVLVHKTEKLSL